MRGEGASERPLDSDGEPSARDARAASTARHAMTVAVKLLMWRNFRQTCAHELRKMLTPEAIGEFKFVSAGIPGTVGELLAQVGRWPTSIACRSKDVKVCSGSLRISDWNQS